VYDATSTNWVVGASSNPGSVLAASTTTISNGQWFSDTTFTVGASGLTLTLPTSANAVANGGITIQSMGYPITLAAQGSDTVQYGSGAGTASLLVPANAIAVVTRSGTTFQVAWKFAELQTMSWSAGMNLAACASPPCSIPMFHVGQQTTLGLAQAMVSVPAGGTATLDIITAPDGTALGAGTVISTAPANANGAAGTLQTLSLSSGTLAAGTTVGVRATGWATGAQAGIGMVQIALQ
jgi:hypothetical protein